MTSRMRKLTTWTISDLSRLTRPPSCPPSAAQATPGPWNAHPARSSAPAHTIAPVQLRSRRHLRRLSLVSCCSRRFVKTITRPARCQSPTDKLPRDHAAADHALAPVPDHRLPRRDGPLRLVEHDLGRVRVDHAHRGRRGRVAVVADLRLDAHRGARRRARDKVHRARHEPVTLQIGRAADHDGGSLGIEVDDVERPPYREAEPLLLPDGVAGDAAVHPEHPALAVDDGAGAEHTG